MTVILKLGVWAKTKIVNDPVFGREMANRFVKHEMGVRKRRVGNISRKGHSKVPFSLIYRFTCRIIILREWVFSC